MSWSRFIPGFDPVSLYLPSSSITFQPPNSHEAVGEDSWSRIPRAMGYAAGRTAHQKHLRENLYPYPFGGDASKSTNESCPRCLLRGLRRHVTRYLYYCTNCGAIEGRELARDGAIVQGIIQPPDEARGDTAPALRPDLWADVACVAIWLAAVVFWIVRWWP